MKEWKELVLDFQLHRMNDPFKLYQYYGDGKVELVCSGYLNDISKYLKTNLDDIVIMWYERGLIELDMMIRNEGLRDHLNTRECRDAGKWFRDFNFTYHPEPRKTFIDYWKDMKPRTYLEESIQMNYVMNVMKWMGKKED